jgi:TonB-linked SusC/RagA family outer membrane protein
LNTTGYTQSFNSSLSGMLTATRKLDFVTKGLFVKGNYSFDGYYTNDFTRKRFERTALYNGVGDVNDTASYTLDGNDQPLQAPTSAYQQRRNIWMDLSLNYERQFKEHAVTGLLLANRTQLVKGGEIPYVSQGVVARLTYAYKNTYFAEFNAGYNGTDNFAKGKRYGFFPAVSAGWIVSKEAFLRNNRVIDFLKLRASYGLTGNDQLSGRRWLFVSEYQNGTAYNYGDPLVAIAGTKEGPMANADVTWEKAHKLNIGLEVKLWKELLGITIDLFREKRDDILITRGTVPAIIGVTPGNMPPANMGSVVNRGFEIELVHKGTIHKVNYFIRTNASYAKNKILFMDEVGRPYDYLKRTGQALGQLYGLTSIGFFRDKADIANSAGQFGNLIPGDLKYRDLNGDGVINSNDEGPIGRTNTPEILFGFSGGFNWKGLDFSFLFQGAANYNVAFSNEGAWEFYNGGSAMVQHLGRWTPATAATASYPVLHNGININNHRASSFFMKDASYVRLKNLELGYTFKQVRFAQQAGFSAIRVFANGMNLLTWDKMGGQNFDPEAPSGNGFFYPQLKVYNAGFSLDF